MIIAARWRLLCGGQQAGEMLVLAKGSVMNLAATFLWRSCTTRTRHGQFLHRGEISDFHV